MEILKEVSIVFMKIEQFGAFHMNYMKLNLSKTANIRHTNKEIPVEISITVKKIIFS